jgi:molybdopterin-guanine dinucleotide biosynthesis protein B
MSEKDKSKSVEIPKVIAVVGKAQSGKTRLIQRLIPELKKRGHSVAAIKHCGHGFIFDVEGKDSWQFMEAGSDGVAMVAPERLAVIRRKAGPKDFQAIARQYFKDIDIVLVEGGKTVKGLKKIEVLRKGQSEKVESSPEDLIAVISDFATSAEKPLFHPNQIGQIAKFLESGIQGKTSHVYLDVDGNSIPLNAFVQEIFEDIVAGMVHSLRGVKKNSRNIIISVIRRDGKDEKL